MWAQDDAMREECPACGCNVEDVGRGGGHGGHFHVQREGEAGLAEAVVNLQAVAPRVTLLD